MIPNHEQFIEAIKEKKKVCVRFYSKSDGGVLDRVCAPLDYGPGGGTDDGLNRYSFWDYGSNTGIHVLSLLPQQILDLRLLGEVFDPVQLDVSPPHWFVPRNWVSPPGIVDAFIGPSLPFSVAAGSVGGQAQRSETAPVNKE